MVQLENEHYVFGAIGHKPRLWSDCAPQMALLSIDGAEKAARSLAYIYGCKIAKKQIDGASKSFPQPSLVTKLPLPNVTENYAPKTTKTDALSPRGYAPYTKNTNNACASIWFLSTNFTNFPR